MKTYEIVLLIIAGILWLGLVICSTWNDVAFLYKTLQKAKDKNKQKEGENMEDLLNSKRNADKRYFEDEIGKFGKEHHIGIRYAAGAEPWTWYYTFTKAIIEGGDVKIRDREFYVDFRKDFVEKKIYDIRESLTIFFELDRKSYYPGGYISYCPASRLTKEEMNAICGRRILEKFGDDTFPERILEYCKTDVECTTDLYRHFSPKTKFPEIKNVIFQNPATIVFWSDGTKTVVKAKNEAFDEEKGLAMAISKKVLGNKYAWKDEFRKWLPEIPGGPVEEEAATIVEAMEKITERLHDLCNGVEEEAKDEEKTLADEIEYYLHEEELIPRCITSSLLKGSYIDIIRHFLICRPGSDLTFEIVNLEKMAPSKGYPLYIFHIYDRRDKNKYFDLEIQRDDFCNFYNIAADKINQVKDYFGLV